MLPTSDSSSSASKSNPLQPTIQWIKSLRIVLIHSVKSYRNLWSVGEGEGIWNRLFVILLPFLAASLSILLTPRTVLNEGVLKHPMWPILVMCIIAVLLSFPVKNRFETNELWKWTPLLALLLPFAPVEIQIGLVSVSVSGLFSWFSGKWTMRLSGLFATLSFVWVIFLGTVNLYYYAIARIHYYPILANVLAFAFNLCGATAHSQENTTFVAFNGITYPILASPDKFGGTFALLLSIGLGLLGWLHRFSAKRLLLSLLTVVLYSVMQAVWVISQHITLDKNSAWWDEPTIIIGYLPLVPILFLILRNNRIQIEKAVRAKPFKAHLAAQPLTIFGTLLLFVGHSWVDPGLKKQGIVMVDEHYSRWEWSEDSINTRLYGVKTVYSYSDMMDMFKHYYPVKRNFEEINDSTLKDVSVLILKTPTSPYPPGTLKAIWRFIENGGGVWLIGDHTDVFGMDSYLNAVGAPYDIGFEYNAVVDPETNRQLMAPEITSHPIIRRMPLFLWYTSDQLRVPWNSTDVIMTPRLLVDNPDFSVNTFFGNFTPDFDEQVGPVVQCAAIQPGAGRILCWSDSTVFSNFAIFLPGKMELALSSVDWLNRKNTPINIQVIFLLLGVVLTITGLCISRDCIFIPAIWAGLALSIMVSPFVYDRDYPRLSPSDRLHEVAFYEPRVRSHLPVGAAIDTDNQKPDCYLTSFVAAQRVGKRPFVADSLDQAIRAETIVIIHSHFDLTKEQVDRLHDWVKKGGRLLLVDGAVGKQEDFQDILDPTGMKVLPSTNAKSQNTSVLSLLSPKVQDTKPEPDETLHTIKDEKGEDLADISVDAAIAGGKPIFVDSTTNQVVAAAAFYGKGMVIATSTKTLFSDQILGDNSDIPDERQLRLLNYLFSWYQK